MDLFYKIRSSEHCLHDILHPVARKPTIMNYSLSKKGNYISCVLALAASPVDM